MSSCLRSVESERSRPWVVWDAEITGNLLAIFLELSRERSGDPELRHGKRDMRIVATHGYVGVNQELATRAAHHSTNHVATLAQGHINTIGFAAEQAYGCPIACDRLRWSCEYLAARAQHRRSDK